MNMEDFDPRQVLNVAAKEWRDRLRSRWVLAMALVFAVFALVVSYFGAAQQGVVGVRSVEITVTSLVSLVIYLVPLIALILGFDAVVGERERGTLDLLLSLPLTRAELLLGKYLGLAAALTLATLGGFGLGGAVVLWQLPWDALYHYGGFVLSAWLLGLVFLSIAVALSVVSSERSRASGLAIAVWFFFVLIFDLLLLGLVVAGGGAAGPWLPYLLLLNPTDVFRVLNIFGDEGARQMYGLGSLFPQTLTDPWILGAVMLAWIVVPLSFASWRFRR